MTSFEELIATLNWILDTPVAQRNSSDPRLEPSWRLELLESDGFLAKTILEGDAFVIQVSSSAWPCLEAFCACGIDWKGNARRPRRKTFKYSEEEWEAIIGFTNDLLDWSLTDAVAVTRMLEHSAATKRVRIPLGTGTAQAVKIYTAAAFYGMLWLICHEGAHAWRRHFQLDEGGLGESIREQSELLRGADLSRTRESEADWQAAKFVFAHVLDCVVAGYRPALAYGAGFGVAAAVLLLNPSRHNLFDRALDYDPGWMRVHALPSAAKAGYWTIVEASYPDYVKLMRQRGVGAALGHKPGVVEPSARFNEASDATQAMFWSGLGDAQRFAREIGEANSAYRVARPEHFKFGEAGDWKEFQVQVMETDVLGRRERAREELRRLLPTDPRFQDAGPLGRGALLRMGYLAASRKRRAR